MVGSFYDPELDEGCAFEELISFHGGIGGPQTQPFILAPIDAAAAGGADRRRGARPRGAVGLAAAAERRRAEHGRTLTAGAVREMLTAMPLAILAQPLDHVYRSLSCLLRSSESRSTPS